MLKTMPLQCAVASRRALELALDGRIESVHAADDPEDDVVVEERPELAAEVFLQERHERRDLEVRALPVLRRERVERERRELEARGGLDGRPHRGDARAVALHPRQPPLARPAPVAVHDDGHVPGQAAEVERVEKRRSGVPGAAMESLSIIGTGAKPPRTANSIATRARRRRPGAPGALRGIQDAREREAAGLRRRPGPRRRPPRAGSGPARRRAASRRAAAPCRAGSRPPRR